MNRKIYFILLVVLLLSGCNVHKDKSQNHQEISNNYSSKVAEDEDGQEISNENMSDKDDENIEKLAKQNNEEETDDESDWFVGAINENLKIHMKLFIKDDKVSGVYYYDKYKKNIKFNGYISNNCFIVYEGKSNNCIEAIIISDNLIQGVWTDDTIMYPMYLIKQSCDESIPEEPNNSLMQWGGIWKGIRSGYYAGSELLVYPIFNNLIKFEITAFSGTHSGGFSSLALVNDDAAVYKGENDTEFRFSLNNENNIELDTNDYSYYCGMGVSFDSVYTKDSLSIQQPSAKEVGLVYSDEQEKELKELTGEYYDTFIQYAQFYSDGEDLDNVGANVRIFGIRGYYSAAIVMINEKDNIIIAAVDGGEAIYYFTNNKLYSDLPETIQQWCNEKNGLKVIKIIK